ncbi:hypothetical protein LTR82_005464 [Friedmanniomyces endolithicus]|uniref:Uncharacterized protein n=1 Tax=Friedmanniomyces endolithicus TaxID=329885 RepID=A0AAN6JAX2_9PEZI|nr:hypothetical protein LTR82_005464 [Friedmanniomyces endolithicus]
MDAPRMSYQDDVNARYIQDQDGLDAEMLMDVMIDTVARPIRTHLLTLEEMADLAPNGIPWLGHGPYVAPPTKSRGTTSTDTDNEPSMSEDEGHFGPDHTTAASSGGLSIPTAAPSNPTATAALQQVAVAPPTTGSTNSTFTAASQQIAAATIAATHPAVPAPTSAYQLIVRAPPDPNRFASQYLRPHLLTHPPPPAQGLVIVSINVTNVINNGAQLVGKVPHEAQPPLGRMMTMPEIMLFAPNWLRCPEVALRAIRNGHETADLIDMFFAPNGPPNAVEKRIAASRIRKQLSDGARLLVRPGPGMTFGGQMTCDTQKVRQDLGPQLDLTANAWELRAAYISGTRLTEEFVHVKLSAFYGTLHINTFPIGRAEGVLTKCLRFARSNPNLDLDSSHFDWIIQTQGF